MAFPIAVAPVLFMLISPDIATPVATFETLPTKILAEVRVVPSFPVRALFRSVWLERVPVIVPQLTEPTEGTAHTPTPFKNFVLSLGSFGVNPCFVVDTSAVVRSVRLSSLSSMVVPIFGGDDVNPPLDIISTFLPDARPLLKVIVSGSVST